MLSATRAPVSSSSPVSENIVNLTHVKMILVKTIYIDIQELLILAKR